MNNRLLPIDTQKEKERIVAFLQTTFEKQQTHYAVIGVSGGIDSAVSLALLNQTLHPEQIIVAHMYYFESKFSEMETVLQNAQIPNENIYHISIKEPVDALIRLQQIEENESNRVRIGNIAARIRMIVLYDLAKKHLALVCGTENKSENLLGYFTRFGDQASDIEPIAHLYKTQVFQLASALGLPENIIKQQPSAGLWQGQTDEGQFGFSYEEADQVLFLHIEKGMSSEEIQKQGFTNAKKILAWREKNLFKQNVPYHL